MDDERRGFLGGNLAYVLWGLLTLYWHELTGLEAFGLIAWRIVWSVAALALGTNWNTYVWRVTHGRVIETVLGYFLAATRSKAASRTRPGWHERTRGRVRYGPRVGRGQRVTNSSGTLPWWWEPFLRYQDRGSGSGSLERVSLV